MGDDPGYRNINSTSSNSDLCLHGTFAVGPLILIFGFHLNRYPQIALVGFNCGTLLRSSRPSFLWCHACHYCVSDATPIPYDFVYVSILKLGSRDIQSVPDAGRSSDSWFLSSEHGESWNNNSDKK